MSRVFALFSFLMLSCCAGAYAAPQAQDFDEAKFCAFLREVVHAAKSAQGKQMDAVTRHEGMELSCEDRRLLYKTSVALEPTQERHEQLLSRGTEWKAHYCRDDLFRSAIGSGWDIRLSVIWQDKSVTLFKAECGQTVG